MSALPPKADIAESDWHVRFVPKADIARPIDHPVGAGEQSPDQALTVGYWSGSRSLL
jgi:hypothetical protein